MYSKPKDKENSLGKEKGGTVTQVRIYCMKVLKVLDKYKDRNKAGAKAQGREKRYRRANQRGQPFPGLVGCNKKYNLILF